MEIWRKINRLFYCGSAISKKRSKQLKIIGARERTVYKGCKHVSKMHARELPCVNKSIMNEFYFAAATSGVTSVFSASVDSAASGRSWRSKASSLANSSFSSSSEFSWCGFSGFGKQSRSLGKISTLGDGFSVVVASKCAVVIKRGFLGFLKLLNVSVAIGKSGHREEL